MKDLSRVAIFILVLALAGCTSWDKYAAGQIHKYSGERLFTMYEEWGTPVHRTRFVSGAGFYQFQKKGTDCQASVWTNDVDIIVRMAVSGPSTCSAAP